MTHGSFIPGARHDVTPEAWLERAQRLASQLRASGHPLAPLAQQVLEDAASLMRRHIEKPCPHWSGSVQLPGEPL